MSEYPNGFLLFAESIRRKMGGSLRLDAFSHALQDAALPAWEKLSTHEKQEWKARARELQKTDERLGDKREWGDRRRVQRTRKERIKTTRNEHFRGIEEEDYEEEFDFGKSGEQGSGLEEKYVRDKALIVSMLSGMSQQQVKDLRWLCVSAQTFGRTDTECLLAELAINEFTLGDGIVDRVSAIVADWPITNEVSRSRAVFHSNETHKIRLEDCDEHMNKRQVLMEILGRCEPWIAHTQGIFVGLYKKECPSDAWIHIDGRRFLLCVRHEMEELVASLESLKRKMRLDYDGFPIDASRFILLDAFIEGVAEALGEQVTVQYESALDELGKPLNEEYATPWERGDEVFCPQHAPERNSCCASATATRAVFISVFALEHIFK